MLAPRFARLPKTRIPLRKRRRVDLAIIPISYREWNRVYDCNCELVLVFEEDDEEKQSKYDQERATPLPSPTPSLIEESHLVEIMDRLYIALVDDRADMPALRTFDDQPFTHVVQISFETPQLNDPLYLSYWRIEESQRSAPVQRLDLICPAIYLCLCPEQTAVAPEQLHAAREFLSLALPYWSKKWCLEELREDMGNEQSEGDAHKAENRQDDDEEENGQIAYLVPDYGLDDLLNNYTDCDKQEDEVNVLIVAPTGRAVDVLSVLFCYLSFLEDSTPDAIADTNYFDHVWDRVTLGRWSMLYVELIARCD